MTTSISRVDFKGTINDNARTAEFLIPYYFRALVKSLAFGYRFTGKAISPALDQPRDYSQPQKVTITADDDSSVEYTITVNIMPEYELNDFDKPSYVATDSVRISGKNLGVGRGLVSIYLCDINTIEPLSGNCKLTYTIAPDKTQLNTTNLAFSINQIPKGSYTVNIFFPDSDTIGKRMSKNLEVK